MVIDATTPRRQIAVTMIASAAKNIVMNAIDCQR
jgi:hypothetical protein